MRNFVAVATMLTSAALLITDSPAGSRSADAILAAGPAAGLVLSDTWRSPLSSEQLAQIDKYIDGRGKRQIVNQGVTDLLGLTENGNKLNLLYCILKDDHEIYHGFYKLDATPGYLLARRTGKDGGLIVLQVDSNLSLIAAVHNAPGVQLSVVPLSEATRILHDELLIWVDIIDTVIDPKPGPSPSPLP